jgi:hypothetical protein
MTVDEFLSALGARRSDGRPELLLSGDPIPGSVAIPITAQELAALLLAHGAATKAPTARRIGFRAPEEAQPMISRDAGRRDGI